MKLHDILTVKGSDVFTICPEATLAEVIAKLVRCNCGSLVVWNGDRMVGIITERDILKACDVYGTRLTDVSVRESMTSNVTTGSPDDEVGYIMGLMTQKRIRHLPILKEGHLSGMISIGDIVKAQHSQLSMENHYLKEYIHS